MSQSKTFRPTLSVCVAGANPILLTHTLFDAHHREPDDSPIDEFFTRLVALNKLSPHPNSFDAYQAQLVLLGVVAAVESFLRTLFRRIIVLDATAQNCVQEREVSYSAALHLSQELLPEAILERFSFISKKNIVDAMRDLLAVKGNMPSDLDQSIQDYVRVCQMRHCAVHRFGKLGVNNAIFLGLADHKMLLEKPLKLDYLALQNSIAISTGFVKTINNFLFNELLSRVPLSNWTGNYRIDKGIFINYYALFADRTSSMRTAQPKQLYSRLQKEILDWRKANGLP